MQNIDIKISIIVPIYNAENYLKQCINSVISQDYDNFELILINDGSTDNSRIICYEFASIDARIKVYHQENSGAATARNRGLDNATGDYIMFLDSDDYWELNCLGSIVNTIKNSIRPIDVVFLKVAKVYENGVITGSDGYNFEHLTRNEALNYISNQRKVAVSACLKVIRGDLFLDRKLYFEDALLAEDIDWFFRLISIAKNYTTYQGKFYYYRVRGASVSHEISEKRISDYLFILNKWLKYANENLSEEEKIYYIKMIGYEYEILISTIYSYPKSIRDKYIKELKQMFWILQYRNGKRSKAIKLLKSLLGFNIMAKILNWYLNNVHQLHK